mmetsp:Transcript_18468/g.43358  ORF Transcript_18468/g.43358 Transcript_18468/m.43358 type:complete len:92 (+) Transcript_18468:451-726(+)
MLCRWRFKAILVLSALMLALALGIYCGETNLPSRPGFLYQFLSPSNGAQSSAAVQSFLSRQFGMVVSRTRRGLFRWGFGHCSLPNVSSGYT